MSIGIVGLGYVGLPLAVAFAEAGEEVIGLDSDRSKVDRLGAADSYIAMATASKTEVLDFLMEHGEAPAD